MKLSINEKSVDALRTFAETIPTVLGVLEEETERLVQLYYNLADNLGPHGDSFEEMLLHIKQSKQISAEAIEELSYMLRATADRMESFIRHGASYGATNQPAKDIKVQYISGVKKRLHSSGTNPVAKSLFLEFEANVRIVDYDFKGTPFYNSLSNGIKLNAMSDLHNPEGNFSTYWHEVGHFLDDVAGNGHAWLSSDPVFRECLRRDVDAYISKTMIEKHCEMIEAYDIISEELSGDWNSAVSDIFGSLTNCCVQGDWGHHPSYWKSDPSKIEKEAFANMFEASIGDENKLKAMQHFFPTAYSRFEYIIRSR
jgi:hypothetical protein